MDIHVVWAIIAAVLLIVGVGLVVWAVLRNKKKQSVASSDAVSSSAARDNADSARDTAHPEDEQSANVPDNQTVGFEHAETQAETSVTRDVPESRGTRMERLRSRLSQSSNPFGKALFGILTRDNLSEADWEEVEDVLLLADVGTETSMQIVEQLRRDARVHDAQDSTAIRAMLREQLLHAVQTDKDGSEYDRRMELEKTEQKTEATHVIMMVGVNGSGKTTTTGKLSRLLIGEGTDKIVLGAADTFRAAAADQLQTWGQRVGVPVVRSDKEGADPASVAFDAAQEAEKDNSQVLIIDTAGRLQNKTNLMDELGKIRRVVEKKLPVEEVLLVLDATTGQNGMAQAKVFAQAIGITGIVLTKLDGSAKGGIVISVQRELGVPVKFVGLGEGADDLARFDAEGFVDGILGE
ncbi:signal recognition particle-docking protein FtsY [Alloscardovia theropitheci]|uniref:Signal recognition particle receptor FtsY n=1 Tax=Alloscardovia theropitheci TaxID=2496842 RepID=A0A4R0QVK4_9BIFI|nr:signal recognition particle-docking protein FtsY [Alloscardovia theropitheci]TCD54247.1 signal recognition particle-docking protein FtsY [Alloscardovia theropitheci]